MMNKLSLVVNVITVFLVALVVSTLCFFSYENPDIPEVNILYVLVTQSYIVFGGADR